MIVFGILMADSMQSCSLNYLQDEPYMKLYNDIITVLLPEFRLKAGR